MGISFSRTHIRSKGHLNNVIKLMSGEAGAFTKIRSPCLVVCRQEVDSRVKDLSHYVFEFNLSQSNKELVPKVATLALSLASDVRMPLATVFWDVHSDSPCLHLLIDDKRSRIRSDVNFMDKCVPHIHKWF
ncbi:hypothetical protein [Streptococcus sp. zg-JUN1979]|uniref:hypothetical protein n=1 Tax=Streptococcus sp. zg-JUN1979 TaxID=3391450 RepID=UPI0039A6DF63